MKENNKRNWTLEKHLGEVESKLNPLLKAQGEYISEHNKLISFMADLFARNVYGPYESLSREIQPINHKLRNIRQENKRYFLEPENRNLTEEEIMEQKYELENSKQERAKPYFDSILGFQAPERLVIAHSLATKNLVRLCGGECGLGPYDIYSTRKEDKIARENVERLELKPYFKSRDGSEMYGIDEKEVEEIITGRVKNITDKFGLKCLQETEREVESMCPDERLIDSLTQKRDTLNQYLNEQEEKIKIVADYVEEFGCPPSRSVRDGLGKIYENQRSKQNGK